MHEFKTQGDHSYSGPPPGSRSRDGVAKASLAFRCLWLTLPLLNVLFSFRQMTPLHMAASGGHTAIVEHLVENEADVNIKAYSGVSAING